MAIDSIKGYKEQRDKLRQYFEEEKTGDQTLFLDQTKLFKPLIESQQESSNNILERLATNQDVLTNALVPLLAVPYSGNHLPEAIEDVSHSTPKKDENIKNINLDTDLQNDTHTENLEYMDLDMPSVVQKNGNIQETLEKIEMNNRKIGQYLGIKSKKSDKEKDMYSSQQETLKIYKQSILTIKGAEKFIEKSGEGLVKQKRGKGRPRKYPRRILYQDGNDLCVKLNELLASRSPGNTGCAAGLDSTIKAILVELLTTKCINQDDYDKLDKNIFSN